MKVKKMTKEFVIGHPHWGYLAAASYPAVWVQDWGRAKWFASEAAARAAITRSRWASAVKLEFRILDVDQLASQEKLWKK